MCICLVGVCECSFPLRPEEGARYPKTGVTCGFWEQNSGLNCWSISPALPLSYFNNTKMWRKGQIWVGWAHLLLTEECDRPQGLHFCFGYAWNFSTVGAFSKWVKKKALAIQGWCPTPRTHIESCVTIGARYGVSIVKVGVPPPEPV